MKKQLIAVAVLTALMGASVAHANDAAKKEEREKCYGIVKAEKNDCASKDGKNSCAGNSKRSSDANDWVYLPKGVCEKIAGGVKG